MKVAICAGHGYNTAGKRTPDDEREWAFNDKVVRATIAMLEANGVKVLRTDDPTGRTDVGLTARTNAANNWGADVYISVHHNAMSFKWFDGSGGVETYTQTGSQPDSERLAREVHGRVVKAMGLRDRGMKKANFAITRQTRMPAILTEGGFMDSRTDIKAMRDDAKLKAQGEAIAEGVLAYFGDKKTIPAKPQTGGTQVTAPSKPAPAKPAASKSISQMAEEVIAGQHGNGHDARQKSLGINASEYKKVRDEVNRKSMAPAPVSVPKKSVAQMAQEVIDGKHGNGHDARRKSLGINQTEYNQVRDEVNKRAGGSSSAPKKSVSQMAAEVIRGDHGSGHANRQRSLGINATDYAKVRAEVNRRL